MKSNKWHLEPQPPNVGPVDPVKVQQMFELVLALFPVMLELSEDSHLKDENGRLQ